MLKRRKDCQRGSELEELQSFRPWIFFLFVFLLLFSFVFIGGEKCFKLQLSFYRQTQVSNISATQYQVQRCCC